jgi:hypothetical protein
MGITITDTTTTTEGKERRKNFPTARKNNQTPKNQAPKNQIPGNQLLSNPNETNQRFRFRLRLRLDQTDQINEINKEG